MTVFVCDFRSGALERVSAITKYFHGMRQMMNEYVLHLILDIWILGGSSSKIFEPNSGING